MSDNKTHVEHWLNGLPDAEREKVFAAMRGIGERAHRLRAEERFLSAGRGIPVGGAHFDAFVQSDALEEFLSAIRRGMSPGRALEHAKEHAARSVEIWNGRNEWVLHRSKTTCESILQSAFLSVIN